MAGPADGLETQLTYLPLYFKVPLLNDPSIKDPFNMLLEELAGVARWDVAIYAKTGDLRMTTGANLYVFERSV